MTTLAAHSQPAAQRIEELGRIIMAYSEVTERLQQSHDQLKEQVEHLRAELGEKNMQLERRNRLAALGEMAAGLAHEIRNPLGGMQLYASLLAKDVAQQPAAGELVNKISGGVKRLDALVGQVLQFSREMRASIVRFDLAAVVRDTISLVDGQHPCVSFAIDGPASLCIDGDGVLLGQAILNLVLNAIEAMQGSGEVRVSYCPPPPDSEARQFCLSIRDTGPGIDPQVMERIFNPFFTTKDTGTGLGLSIVHRIVEAHEGAISAMNINDALGTGAKFEIRI
jgi:signal transduction histidine kinase